MAKKKTKIVCLANSRKHSGRYVAGLQYEGDRILTKWVRPVSQFDGGELLSERFYAGNEDPKLLDLIELALGEARPRGCHTEDHLVDSATSWSRLGTITVDQLAPFAEPPIGPLWINGKSTRNGENDSISAGDAQTLPSSLKLIRPKSVTLVATQEGIDRPRRKVRGHFSFGKYHYILSVSDPKIESEFARHEIGAERTVMNPFLCVSISEVFKAQNACYKLIAGVVEER